MKRPEKSCEALFPTVVNRPRFCSYSMIRSIVYGRRSGRFASRHVGQEQDLGFKDTRVRPRLLQLKPRILLWLQMRNGLERS